MVSCSSFSNFWKHRYRFWYQLKQMFLINYSCFWSYAPFFVKILILFNGDLKHIISNNVTPGVFFGPDFFVKKWEDPVLKQGCRHREQKGSPLTPTIFPFSGAKTFFSTQNQKTEFLLLNNIWDLTLFIE